MSTYHTQGLVLSSRDFSESDKIFSIYTTTHGKIEARATGVRKIKSKLQAHLVPFSVICLMIAQGQRFDRLAGAIIQKDYKKIKADCGLIFFGSHLLELIDQLTKLYHPDKRIFDLLAESFEILDKRNLKSKELKILYSSFVLHSLSQLGYHPELYRCVRCKKKIGGDKNYFSFKDGSVICEKCFAGEQEVSFETIKNLRLLISRPLKASLFLRPKEDIIDEIYRTVKAFLEYHLDKPLKSERFLNSTLS